MSLKMERQIEVFAAAREGKVEVLNRLLQQNPSILDEIRLTSLTESLLHAATKSGQLNFVVELLKVDGDVAGEVDKEGFRALDIAVIMGKVAIVKELLRFDRSLGGLRGKDNRTALHYAAAKGRVEIIVELLSTCPDCLESVTVHGETALHLAVKSYQLDAFAELVSWLEKLSKQSMINAQDEDGNTVLHLAVATKQYTCLKLVVDDKCALRGRVEVNVRNVKGLTALDISDVLIQDCYDGRIRGILQQAGGVRGEDCDGRVSGAEGGGVNGDGDESTEWMNSFLYKKGKESASETRNALLVVAALITTITFQAGINPPSGLFGTGSTTTLINNSTTLAVANNSTTPINRHGVLVAAPYAGDFIFLVGNSLGFSSACCILSYLTVGFPLYRELSISLFMMSFTYSNAAYRISNGALGTTGEIILYVMFCLPFLVRWLPYLLQKRWKTRAPPTPASHIP